jgi:uncharacterized protein
MLRIWLRRHNEIAELCAKYPGRFFGLARLRPHSGRDLLTEDGQLAFETAYEFGIPAMVHTGAGIPFSLPALCIPAAQKFLS